jgi:hypothetical protein
VRNIQCLAKHIHIKGPRGKLDSNWARIKRQRLKIMGSVYDRQ